MVLATWTGRAKLDLIILPFQSSALFYGNALIVSAIPVWLFWRVHSMDPVTSAPLFAAVTLVCTWLVSFAYRNTKHLLKHKVAVKREGAVTKVRETRLRDTGSVGDF
jgi:translocon-associated protein subunit gamma